jgi:hypothetical protein
MAEALKKRLERNPYGQEQRSKTIFVRLGVYLLSGSPLLPRRLRDEILHFHGEDLCLLCDGCPKLSDACFSHLDHAVVDISPKI